MKPSSRNLMFLTAALALLPSLAYAHCGIGKAGGLLSGVAHPLTGLDHVCAMLAVGLWAAQLGGRALWSVPLTFVSVMAVGGVLGMAGIGLPFVETGMLASVLILGVLVAAAVKLPLPASAVIVGLFALFHGHAHGAEMPATASGMMYGIGFIGTTALLHLAGIGWGMAIQKFTSALIVRYTGGAIAALGVYLCLVA